MSDVAQGPGWWKAPDGKFYPPGPTQGAFGGPPQKKKRSVAKGCLATIGGAVVLVVILVVVVVAVAGGKAAHDINSHKGQIILKATATNGYLGDIDVGDGGNSSSYSPGGTTWTMTVTDNPGIVSLAVGADILHDTAATVITCEIDVPNSKPVIVRGTGQTGAADCSATPGL